MDFNDDITILESGPLYRFADWPATHFDVGPAGVYTVWNDDLFLYVGMSYRNRDATTNVQAKGVFGRLASHASGRRSGDQFNIYICDRFVVPTLTADDLDALAHGERFLDLRTRVFITEHLGYRVTVTDTGASARALEHRIRRDGLPHAGRPQINPA